MATPVRIAPLRVDHVNRQMGPACLRIWIPLVCLLGGCWCASISGALRAVYATANNCIGTSNTGQLYNCSSGATAQEWTLSDAGLLTNTHTSQCLEASPTPGSLIQLSSCDSNAWAQRWTFDAANSVLQQQVAPGQSQKLCLGRRSDDGTYQAWLELCNSESQTQRWRIAAWDECIHFTSCNTCRPGSSFQRKRHDCRWCTSGKVCLPATSGRRRSFTNAYSSCWRACLEDRRVEDCEDDGTCSTGQTFSELQWVWFMVSLALIIPCGCLIACCCLRKHKSSVRACFCCLKKSTNSAYVAPETQAPQLTNLPGGTRNLARALALQGSAADLREFRNALSHGANGRVNSERIQLAHAPGSPSNERPWSPNQQAPNGSQPRVALASLPAIRQAWISGSRRHERRVGGAQTASASSEADEKKAARLALEATEFVSGLKVKKWRRQSIEEGEQCAICIEEWKDSEYATLLPCGHAFHKECLLLWSAQSTLCPICKVDAKSG